MPDLRLRALTVKLYKARLVAPRVFVYVRTLGPEASCRLTPMCLPPPTPLEDRLTGWKLLMVVVTTAKLVRAKRLRIVPNTRRVAAMRIALTLWGVSNAIGLDISAILVFTLCVRLVTVQFTPLAERPARQCMGLSGLRAGLVAMSIRNLRNGNALVGRPVCSRLVMVVLTVVGLLTCFPLILR